MLSLVIIKISLSESVDDWTTCPALHGFVRSIPNSDRTLSIDQLLLAALRGKTTYHTTVCGSLQVPRCAMIIIIFRYNTTY